MKTRFRRRGLDGSLVTAPGFEVVAEQSLADGIEFEFGEERLQFLVKDLKEIVRKEPTQARPLFLLAYIAYNTGNERMAAGYLDLAEKRAGAGDPFYSLVRKNWTLPAAGEAPAIDLNK